jgi:hypothetical protein
MFLAGLNLPGATAVPHISYLYAFNTAIAVIKSFQSAIGHEISE